MKIEVFENDKSVDASVLCNNTYEAKVLSFELTSQVKNSRVGDDNAYITLECGKYTVKMVLFGINGYGSFDFSQYTKISDLEKDELFKISFGQCKNGKPFILDVYKRVTKFLPLGQWQAEDDNDVNEDYGVELTEYVKC